MAVVTAAVAEAAGVVAAAAAAGLVCEELAGADGLAAALAGVVAGAFWHDSNTSLNCWA